MTGYVTKHASHTYNGEYTAGHDLRNGMFVCIISGQAHIIPGGGTVYKVQEKTTLFGLPAFVLEVIELKSEAPYFVDTEWDVPTNAEWDESDYIVRKGSHVRLKRLLPGEQFIRTVSESLYNQLPTEALLMTQEFAADDMPLVYGT